MAFSLNDITQTKHATPPRIVLHGLPGVGKSSWFANAPRPIFIQTEDGLNGIDASAFPLATTYQDVLDQLDSLINEDHNFKTVVIDSADWLEKFIHAHVCQTYQVVSIELAAGGYGKGYSIANNHWWTVLEKLRELNLKKGMIVGIVCHSCVITINDPLNEAYDAYKLKLHSPKKGNGACELFQEWADIIGFANMRVVTVKSKTDKGGENYRGVSTKERVLFLDPSPAYIAKNRYSLPEELPLDFNVLLESLA